MPRAKNKANQCCESVALLRFQRMVQDYRLCAGTCVDASGLPLDYYNTVTGRSASLANYAARAQCEASAGRTAFPHCPPACFFSLLITLACCMPLFAI
jgi:hypothetical protein